LGFVDAKGTAEDAHHYCYEVKMVQGLLPWLEEQIQTDSKEPWDVTLSNATMEASLIHVRNVFEFYFPKNRRADDITSRDFVAPAWKPSGSSVDRLSLLIEEIHKRLAHLTRRRHTPFDGWRLLVMAGDVLEMNDQFLERLSREKRPWFDQALKASQAFNLNWGGTYRATLSEIDARQAGAPSRTAESGPPGPSREEP
jgi:hypothetical protein